MLSFCFAPKQSEKGPSLPFPVLACSLLDSNNKYQCYLESGIHCDFLIADINVLFNTYFLLQHGEWSECPIQNNNKRQ